MTVDEVFSLSKIDPWFLHQIKQIIDMEKELREQGSAHPERPGSLRSIILSGAPRNTVFPTAGLPNFLRPPKTP